ncbi:NAD(P)-dependent oxidoreductase [Candidatus Micrarchaeota archaeon]|nr:NAD(P)-dependent oxidoreductase [Candidatus Micrarchaeota archaeon]
MHCLIIGGSGLVGYTLVEKLKENYKIALTYCNHQVDIDNTNGYKINLENHAHITSLLDKIKPSIVCHVAAPPSVDTHETEKEKSYSINVETTRAIAEKTKKMNSKLVYLSTSNVFPPVKRIFQEDDIPAPINFYGACKLGGELAVAKNPNHLIIRTDQIYGWNKTRQQKKSFVVSTLDKLESDQIIEVCEDWYNRPTYVEDLVSSIKRLIELDKVGTYHATGSTYLNRLEWAKKIAMKFEMDDSLVKGINSGILHLPAIRANVNLGNTKIQKETKIKMRTIEEGLNAMKNEKH